MNILYFEGAGMDYTSEHSNVGNYRIRTAFKNLDGVEYYLELGRGHRRNEKGKTVSEWALYIDHLFSFEDLKKHEEAVKFNNKLYIEYRKNNLSMDDYLSAKIPEPSYDQRLNHLETNQTDYTKEGIAEWINNNLNCDFDSIQVLDMFYGYRVHGDNRTYNLIDNHNVDHEQAVKRRNAYNSLDMEYRQLLNEKYSKISLKDMSENSITIRCYASDKQLGDIPREKTVTV